ncbi:MULTISPECIES: oxygen-independent coproporphyrinogen III oxidase [Rhizobium]|uniref:oxygen-independent coproporphyrinogen III oxidase n=1 Tax=Rhizobium TaxID=379 RepID=UPI001B327254|nr:MULTISPECIES: oxygen-independent coproporphyrinogen III oxidase [Rhizobium]MBX4911891.1 oxygen-independent coproporphyrinogen III oxidase [Rhizobium bangladeshense]MBX5260834.1 oxygen-independent coproporphyrinogen III oxidase [Rhizobium sp. NLR16b]MBX5266923.1 oxygen-independent coproporphyrinogen III oxidase [Rhizobium sp. NLR16a]MBX5315491.1 oxygen-independent coproporphyrinogen III oxidase [Rhizobium sp. NLR11b]QTV00491.1 oxygen-independent coproporphyrinogen III oxidase [Rhizobium sp. 
MSDDLVAKYGDARLPRYTSYPTAPAFSATVGPDEYARGLADIGKTGPVSVYLHVPFCHSMCWYCGCHTTNTRQDAPVVEYLDVMNQEIELVSFAAGNDVPVRNVHFGGGTPTIMKPRDFSALMAKLRSAFAFEADASVAVEIDPRTLAAPMIDALGENDVDRASLGVQSFDPVVQAAINRLQSFEQTERAVVGLRSAGVTSINFDLIYGLPKQTVQSCVETVRLATELRPERFAVFGYAHIPAFKKHQRLIDEASLPDAKQRNEQAEAIARELQQAGYVRIGLDHFALPQDQLALAARNGTMRRNFQGYTTDDCDSLIGLGASAIGRLPSGYMQNHVPLGLYAERVAAGMLPTAKGYLLTEEDKLRARIIERLMCDFEVNLGKVSSGSGFDTGFLVERNERLGELVADGVVAISGERIVVSQDARFMVRAVAAAFDAYFGSHGRTHSKAA